ncbi:hypothetical protein AMECASPLE_033800 [Ameca splendens]|uniref:Uncharacterized protein n=1 Tax=Ameca splendens TaxID=208324 RepID=A0ABV0YI00_9TELE
MTTCCYFYRGDLISYGSGRTAVPSAAFCSVSTASSVPPLGLLISAKFLRTSPGTPGGTAKLLAGLRRRLFKRNLQRDDEECAPPPEHHLTSHRLHLPYMLLFVWTSYPSNTMVAL